MSHSLPHVFSATAGGSRITSVTSSAHHSNNNVDARRKMTCRTPSSASSRSTASSSSGVSSANSTDSSGNSTDWQQSVSIREIYKTGKLGLLVDKKGIFWRHEQRPEPYWCVFCIHDESYPFLELYEDHKSSLTHQPARVISLVDCQHVSPNISLAEDKHSFTLTLAREIYQFSAANQADMHDWIATLKTRLQDLQGSEASQNTYTRCPLPAKSERLLTPEPLFVELPPLLLDSQPPTERTRHTLPRSSPTPRPTDLSSARRVPERRPSPLPPNLPLPVPHCTPLASPPACEAPPVPTMPPPVPPRGVRSMRPVPHPLVTAQLPPPPPPRAGDQQDKPPRPPRKDDLLKGKDTQMVRQEEEERLPINEDRDVPLIYLGEEEEHNGTCAAPAHVKSEYGTLLPRKKSPQLVLAVRPPVEVVMDHKRETRSRTASPALSERSVTSTVSEPSGESPSPAVVDSDATHVLITPRPATAPAHTLRQQQVDRLKQEMCEPNGVKVRVRRKDCQTALALVDGFGRVWVAGWKQKEHPHFHSLFHLGDQVLAVNGIYVSKTADVFRILKDCQQEKQHALFNVSRIPWGRVFVLARQHDGQELGFLREGNTAEIKSVLPDGLAKEHGLPARAVTCDGSTLCSWVITEINHRPLNWFFKDNEIDDRLKAVGKEISILVQPSELVNVIKKQLRALRNYKDFIVQ